MTQRPELDISPWTDHEAKGPSGNPYSYMKLDGPSADAPTMLLLHGGIFDNRFWYYTQDLSEHFQVIALEIPDNNLYYTGHVNDLGKIVDDFLRTREFTELYIAAVSNGAYYAIEYASGKADDRLKAVVLVSTVMLSISDEEVKKRTRMARFALGLKPDKLRSIVQSRASKADYATAPGPIQQTDIFYVRPYPYYYQLFSVPYHQGERTQNTKDINCPVLVLHGEEDDIMPIHAARLTPEVFPDAEFKAFPGYGHAMTFSHGPDITDAITDFLKRKKLLPAK